MHSVQVTKLALLGGTGVGKDTFVQILQRLLPSLSIRRIRLAEPLYEVQNFIYKTCSREISDEVQDGVLLNFLGKHMRSINPHVLLDRFAQSIREETSADLILCSDVRPIDAPFVRKMGFSIVHIVTNPDVAFERRKKRGDLSLGNSSHETEAGISSSYYDIQISNNGSIEDFQSAVSSLIKDYYNDFNRL
jgi:cytidine deaminase